MKSYPTKAFKAKVFMFATKQMWTGSYRYIGSQEKIMLLLLYKISKHQEGSLFVYKFIFFPQQSKKAIAWMSKV